MDIKPTAEAKIIITLKAGGVHIEGNPGNIELCRMMLCAAICGVEQEFQRQQARIIQPSRLKLS